MGYLIFFWLFYPIWWGWGKIKGVLFPTRTSKKLVFATAKLGDYFNQSVIFEKVGRFEIVVSDGIAPLAEIDPRIEKVWRLGEVKRHKLKFFLHLLSTPYREVFVLVPNSFNLFSAQLAGGVKRTFSHYNQKWYEKGLMVEMEKVVHTLSDLTVQTYLKLVGENDYQTNWKLVPYRSPSLPHLSSSNRFKIGISVAAGNRLKLIPAWVWDRLIPILERYPAEYHLFGVKGEERFAAPFLEKGLKNRVVNWIGKVDLPELPAYLSQLDLYISADSGNSYIADQFRVPILLFAGPCSWQEQRPLGERVKIVPSSAPCAPFSLIFKIPPYPTSPCGDPFEMEEEEWQEVEKFISQTYKWASAPTRYPIPFRKGKILKIDAE